MQESHPLSRARRFIAAPESKQYPVLDLTGEQRQMQGLRNRLDGLVKSLNDSLTQEYRRQLNHNSLKVSVSTWSYGAAPAVEHWQAAFDAGTPDQIVYFGLDNKALFSVSELFFGGQPDKLAEAQLAKRTASDTENRLVRKLFNSVLGALCSALELRMDGWQSRQLGSQPDFAGLWTALEVATSDWSFKLYCCWPLDLNGTGSVAESAAPDLRHQLSRSARAVKVRLRVELAQMELSLGELMQLQQGDILRMDLKDMAIATIGKQAFVTGKVCEHGDQLALRVTNGVGDFA